MTQEEKDRTLMTAVENKNDGEIKEALKLGADPNKTIGGDYPLIAACRYHCRNAIKVLLEAGADANVRNEWGETPLVLMTTSTSYEKDLIPEIIKIIKDLLEHGADPNIIGRYGYALHIASGNDYSEITAILLDMGADVNKQDNMGYTPLHYTMLWGSADMVKILLKAGADPNIQTRRGATPLMHGAAVGNIDAMFLLTNAGADTSIKNKKNETVFDILEREFPDKYCQWIRAEQLNCEDTADKSGLHREPDFSL